MSPNSRNPVFNSSFSFPGLTCRRGAALTLKVMDAESFGNDDFVGEITVDLAKLETQVREQPRE